MGLKAYSNIDLSKISVSGISSGAFVAAQMGVAFSKSIMGIGMVAGGPFYCNQGNLPLISILRCMLGLFPPKNSCLIEDTHRFARDGLIDPVEYNANTKVFIFRGTKDLAVSSRTAKLAYEYFSTLAQIKENVLFESSIRAVHLFPTTKYGNPYDANKFPLIGKGDYDGAGAILKHIYGELGSPLNEFKEGNFSTFSQKEFFDRENLESNKISMDEIGYVYIPSGVKEGKPSKLHIVLHGCLQGVQVIKDRFPKQTGYAEWAESNNIVLLFPQVMRSVKNPLGCWDWWGYSGKDFYTKSGPQMRTIMRMVEKLTGQPLSSSG